jgi:hypothetical protein
VSVEVASAKRDWEDGYRRLLAAARDPREGDRLYGQIEAVTAELRRRVGSTFTTVELAEAYDGSESWSSTAISDASPTPGWPRTATMAADAAFHLYARGAIDYAP